MHRMFALLWALAKLANSLFQHSAALTNLYLFAAMATPFPLPHRRMPNCTFPSTISLLPDEQSLGNQRLLVCLSHNSLRCAPLFLNILLARSYAFSLHGHFLCLFS